MNWTKEQEKAIKTKGMNIIVSAGAGSGKTAVLTERVIQKLLNGTHINNLLLITFTNNAAAEMKTRIKKKILNYPEIAEEIKLVDSADITTFDAFVLSIVKKYHYYLNLSKDLFIIDSSIINKIKKDYINEIFDSYYKNNDKDFENLIQTFCEKNDKNLKKVILEIDKNLDLITNKDDYLNNYINYYYSENNIEYLFKEYENSLRLKIESIKNLSVDLSYEVSSDYYQKFENSLLALFNANNYNEIRSAAQIIDLPRLMNATDKAKKYKEKITKIKNDIKNSTYYDQELLIHNFNDTKDNSTVIINIIKDLNKRVNDFKTINNAFEFNDISRLAIKLINNYEDVKVYLKDKYEEILIDEYQDTSDVQEELINLIKHDNVYMVGDIKQSIYRFRNANPNIFKYKYEKYKNNIDGIKIDLNENFRSRSEVLESINQIFKHIMDNTIGNANYLEEHQLIFGNKSYQNEGANNQNNYLEIYNYEDTQDYTKEEIEAFIIANDIKDKIINKYLVFDNELRPCTYKDFCILMDRSTSFETYKKIFDYLNIPLNVYKDEDILLTEEVLIIKNIISLILDIKNKNFNNNTKLYYASIARSYLYNIKDQEIYDIISNNNITKTEIYKKCKTIASKVDNLNNSKLLETIINDFNFYNKMITIGNINKRSIILNNLLTKFEELSKANININTLTDYLDSLLKDGESIKLPAILNDGDFVTITNIHKSKGLEYKICYYSGLYMHFNTMDIKKRIIWNNNYGLILPSFNDGLIQTFVSTINKDNYYLDEISERIRLFYVALTRAKEKMIIVSSLKNDVDEDYDANGIVNNINRISYNSYDNILSSCYSYIKDYIKKVPIPKIDINYKFSKGISLENFEKGNMIKVNELDNSLDLINNEHYSKNNYELYSEEETANMSFGIKMHSLLENLDFKNPNISLYSNLEKEIIEALLNNPILKNINDAKIYKEYEFIYERNNSYNHGIIDLMLEYDDHIDIIDYKLKNTIDPAYKKQLNGYKEYITNKTQKKVNTYLYSLLDKKLIIT